MHLRHLRHLRHLHLGLRVHLRHLGHLHLGHCHWHTRLGHHIGRHIGGLQLVQLAGDLLNAVRVLVLHGVTELHVEHLTRLVVGMRGGVGRRACNEAWGRLHGSLDLINHIEEALVL